MFWNVGTNHVDASDKFLINERAGLRCSGGSSWFLSVVVCLLPHPIKKVRVAPLGYCCLLPGDRRDPLKK